MSYGGLGGRNLFTPENEDGYPKVKIDGTGTRR